MAPGSGAAPLQTSHWPADTSEPIVEWTVGGVLREAAAEAGPAPALVARRPDGERAEWSFVQLLEESERAAAALLARFGPTDRVAIWAPNRPEWLFAQFGASLAGLTVVAIDPTVPADRLARVLAQTHAAGLFTVHDAGMEAILEEVRPRLTELREVVFLDEWKTFLAGGVPAELPDVRPGDPCRIQFTLGTTGEPKPVVLHHRAWTNNAKFIAGRLQATAGEAWVNPMPYFHVSGFGPSTLAALQSRVTQVLSPYDRDVILDLTQTERAALVSVPPTMLTTLLDHPELGAYDVSALRVVSCGGMPFNKELAQLVEGRLDARFTMAYGQTESCGIVYKIRSDDVVEDMAGSAGRPLPQVEAKVVDPQGATVPTGEVGEICVRTDQVMIGYLDLPEATAEKIDSDGWLHMGDLGSIDRDGCFRLAGRREELILREGEVIFPREIEEALLEHPHVADAAVVGVPDGREGEEEIAAFVIPAGGDPSGAELAGHCAERLPASRVPSRWATVDRFPLTPLGKVQKFRLREGVAVR